MNIAHDELTQSEREWPLDAAERGRLTREHATSIALVAAELDDAGNALAAAVLRALAKHAGVAQ